MKNIKMLSYETDVLTNKKETKKWLASSRRCS